MEQRTVVEKKFKANQKKKKSRPYAFKSRDTFGPKVKIKSNLMSRDTRTGQ